MPAGGMQQMSVESGGDSGEGGAGGVVSYFKRSTHPVASVFHVVFKLAAILTYDFGTLFGKLCADLRVLRAAARVRLLDCEKCHGKAYGWVAVGEPHA